MDRLHAMEVFARVVETGSFSAASRDMGIGQPAVSKLVAALEERLAVRLLVRTTRRLQTTEAGQAFYERARLAIAEADEADSAARGLGAGIEGTLRLCAPVTFARLHITPFLGLFLDLHPRISLDLVMEDRSVDLLQDNIDLAFRLGDLPDSSLTARKIAQGARHIVASPAYLARHGAPVSPADLLSRQWLIYVQAVGGGEWRLRRGTAEVSVNVQGRLRFTAAEGVRAAVLAGLGLAIVSEWMMGPELASGAVVPVLTDWQLPPVDLWALHPAGRMPSAKARAFLAWFLSQRPDDRHAAA